MIIKAVFVAVVFIGACSYIKEHPDGALEELVEEGIEEVTGLDVDLSSDDSAKK